MDVRLIFLTAGRHYVHLTLPAWLERFPDLAEHAVVVDDSGDRARRAWLAEQGVRVVPVAERNAGYGPAMQTVMRLAATGDWPFTLFVEDDQLPAAMPASARQIADTGCALIPTPVGRHDRSRHLPARTRKQTHARCLPSRQVRRGLQVPRVGLLQQ